MEEWFKNHISIIQALSVLANFDVVLAAFLTLKPIWKKNKIDNLLFLNCVQCQIYPTGEFTVLNVSSDLIVINSIRQKIVSYGGQFDPNEFAPAPIDIPFTQTLRDMKISKYKSSLQKTCETAIALNSNKIKERLNKHLPLVSKVPKLFSNSLSMGLIVENSPYWILVTEIGYSNSDEKKNTIRFLHRFSRYIDPVDRWVEVN